MRSLKVLLVVALTAVGATLVVHPGGAPPLAATGSAVLASTSPPQYALGRPRVADGVAVRATADGRGWRLDVGGDDPWSLVLEPPLGRDVTVGRYRAVRAAPTAGRAGAHLLVAGQRVPFAGDLDVLRWDVDDAGRLADWDVVLRTPDTSPVGAFFGQVRGTVDPASSASDERPSQRLAPDEAASDEPARDGHASRRPAPGRPAPDGSPTDGLRLAATHLRWPATPVGSVPITAPELVRNVSTSPVTVGSAEIAGPHRGDWAVTADGCGGVVLAPGAACSLTVGLSPTVAGPRTATLVVTAVSSVDGTTLATTATLAAEAPPGVTTLDVAGDDALTRGGARHWSDGGTTALVAARPATGVVTFSVGSPYRLTPEAGAATVTVGGGRPRLGPARTGTDLAQRWVRVTLDGRGWPLVVGEQTVRRFDVDGTGSVLAADLDVLLHDPTRPGRVLRAELRFRDRDDLGAPSPPTGVSVTEVGGLRTVTWAPSSSGDLAATVARLVPGDGRDASATSGLPLAAGRTPSTVLPDLPPGERWTVAVFAVDTAGNVSPPALLPLG